MRSNPRAVLVGPEAVLNHPTPGMHIWGWMAPAELEWLHEQAKRMGSVVEVGSLRGRSSYALATGCKGPVYCIDPFDDPYGECLIAFTKNVGYLSNVITIKGRSPEASFRIPDPVDMVFIDGAHDLESVLADIDGWLPRCRRLICGHDFDHAGYPDVRTAVVQRFGERTTNPVEMIWAVELD